MGGILDRFLSLSKSFCIRQTVTIDGTSYVIKEQIAEGGFSVIELVQHPRTGEYLALKRITCHSIEDENSAKDEIRRHQDHGSGCDRILELRGSQVVGNADIVHGATSEALLLMPFFKRGTLHDNLQLRSTQNNPYSTAAALKLFLEICEGLRHLHSGGLAHRDLKPHNVLLSDKDGSAVIMDLGSADKARVRVETHSQAQQLQDVAAERCSITYRPPELFQVASKCDIDERTDIWSLGCVLYSICYYKSPFDSVWERGDSVALAVQNGGQNLAFPASSANYPAELKSLVKSMLAVELNDRPFIDQVIKQGQDILASQEVDCKA